LWPGCPRLGGLVAMGYPRPEATPDGHETSITPRSQGALVIILWNLFRQLSSMSNFGGTAHVPQGAANAVFMGPLARQRAVDLTRNPGRVAVPCDDRRGLSFPVITRSRSRRAPHLAPPLARQPKARYPLPHTRVVVDASSNTAPQHLSEKSPSGIWDLMAGRVPRARLASTPRR
jgi:hypothetical protein